MVVVPKKELDEKEETILSLEAKCQKMKSDFTRYKERIKDNEKATQVKVHGELAKRLLSVADTLDRAMNSYKTDSGCDVVEKMAEGTRSNLEMTFNQLLNALEMNLIAPPAGERFNDELHTAIDTTQNNFLPDKTIVSLVRNGYMLNGELIRPAEVVISRYDKQKEEAKSKSESILAKFLRSIESKLFKRKFKELDAREVELSKNEELLRRTAKDFDAREEEFKKRIGDWEKWRVAEESKVNELVQSKEALNDELKVLNSQLCSIQAELNEMVAEKEKIVIECIALNRYNKEIFESKENLLKDIEETESLKESLNCELKELEETKVRKYEEEIKEEREKRPLIELETSL